MPTFQEITVEAEQLTVKVGNLTIEAESKEEGQPASIFGCKVLLDGQEPKLKIQRIELVADVNDGLWRVKLHGFV